MKRTAVLFYTFLLLAVLHIVMSFTSSTKGEVGEMNSSVVAEKYFWDNFHQGNYDSIPQMIKKLNLALEENPKDFISVTHLGFLHLWTLSERQRLSAPDSTIVGNIALSKKYFEMAHSLNPNDLRVLGFLADLMLTEGSVTNNKKEMRKGYFLGMKSIRKWPQFNKFSLGYLFSSMDKLDKNFQKALDWQYETIDDCACEKNTKNNLPSAVQKIKNNKTPEIARVCWNSWVAPHNWEGFCLNLGDMLTKNGEVEEAKKIYALAKESDTYEEWPYRAELERRIASLNINAIDFNKDLDEKNLSKQNVIMFNSKMSCMGCHQMSEKEFKKFGHKELGLNYYISKN